MHLYAIYLKNTMEVTLPERLEPVNATEGQKAESLFEQSEFDEAPGQVLQVLGLGAPVTGIVFFTKYTPSPRLMGVSDQTLMACRRISLSRFITSLPLCRNSRAKSCIQRKVYRPSVHFRVPAYILYL